MRTANDNLRNILPKPKASLLDIPICGICGLPMQYDELPCFSDKSKSIKKPKWDGHEKCLEEIENRSQQNYEKKIRENHDERGKQLLAEAFESTTFNPSKRTLENYTTDSSNFELYNTIVGWRYPSKGFLLFGNPGTGKTHLLCGLVRKMCLDNHLVCDVIQVRPWLDMVLQLPFEKGQEKLENAMRTAILVIDDLGAGALSEAADERLQRVLDARIEFDRPTFASTNLTGKDFKEVFSPRTSSRILGAMTPIEVKGKDYRRNM